MDTQLYNSINRIKDSTPNDLELGKKIRAFMDGLNEAKSIQSINDMLKSGTGEHIEYPSSTIITLSKDKLKDV